jgi:hypothetical protein
VQDEGEGRNLNYFMSPKIKEEFEIIEPELLHSVFGLNGMISI